MNRFRISLGFVILLFSLQLNAQEMTNYLSPYKVGDTVEKFKKIIESHDLLLFDIIDHQKTASNIGKTIRPTTTIIFENASLGTDWTACEQTVAIDLPFRVLVWEDEGGDTFISYSNPSLIAKRHQVKDCPDLTDQINRILVRVINETIRQG